MYIPEFWAGVVAGAFGCLAVIIVIGLATSKYQKHKKR